jgi:hypothetical protein
MTRYTISGVVVIALLVWLAAANAKACDLRIDDPALLARTQSLGRVIQETTKRPVHIVFVHGMGAEGPEAAQKFMPGLCRYAPVTCPDRSKFQRVERSPIDLGDWPDKATVLGQPVWRQAADWAAGQPFVDRYVFQRAGAAPVVVDEVNWWPLLFPLKCRVLVAPEAQLSGVDRTHLKLCMRNDNPYHPWLTSAEYAAALKGPQVSGGGALANAALKQQIMNWGLADAAIALGPMRSLFRKTMEKAFDYAASYGGHGVAGQEFVVVSESLGSFVVLDAAENRDGESPRAQEIVTRTSDLYFFANQFRLLELGRIEGLPSLAGKANLQLQPAPPGPPPEKSPFEMLKDWARPRADLVAEAPPKPKQVIAFSDPSDMLTFAVPQLPRNSDGSEAAIVVNVFDRNEINWFGLVAHPVKAHSGHSANDRVLKCMFQP